MNHLVELLVVVVVALVFEVLQMVRLMCLSAVYLMQPKQNKTKAKGLRSEVLESRLFLVKFRGFW